MIGQVNYNIGTNNPSWGLCVHIDMNTHTHTHTHTHTQTHTHTRPGKSCKMSSTKDDHKENLFV